MKELQDYVAPYLHYCQYQRRLQANTIRNYTFDLSYFLAFLAKQRPAIQSVDQVTKKTLELYLANMTTKYKVKTIRRKMACVQAFFSYLEDQELIDDNPFQKFRLRLKEGYRKPKSMSFPEMDLLLRTVYEDEFARPATRILAKLKSKKLTPPETFSRELTWYRDAVIMELLFAVGLRVAELCALKFSDYDSKEHSFYIIGKGNRERVLYLENEQVIRMLNDYLFFRRALSIDLPYLFVTKFNAPMSTQGVRNIVTKYVERSGIHKKITPHVFRHSFATLLLESGVDIKYIQDFLGHSTIATTQIYLHISDEQKRTILATKHPRGQMMVAGYRAGH